MSKLISLESNDVMTSMSIDELKEYFVLNKIKTGDCLTGVTLDEIGEINKLSGNKFIYTAFHRLDELKIVIVVYNTK